jgi:dephospho-CoA kinase
MNRTVLQITGEARAGKSEVCRYLNEAYDFTTILVSDIIRKFAREHDIVLGRRPDYLLAHNKMKEAWGTGIVADTILGNPAERIVVDGIRVPNDSMRLREAVGSKVLALHCPVEVRYQRALALSTAIDPPSFEAFVEDDLTDAYNPDMELQNTDYMMQHADYHLDTDRPFADVLRDVDGIVLPLLNDRPA